MSAYDISEPLKLFSLQEAQELLPLIMKITTRYQKQLSPVQDRLSRLLSNDPRRRVPESDFEIIVSQWKRKIERLGAVVSGLWRVEFNLGEGSLAWRFPELSLSYFKENGKSFNERIKLDIYVEENDPDWAH